MPRSAGYVDAQSLRNIAMALRGLKERSYQAMRLQPGSHVLDVGCGPGVDTVPLGRLVGPTGKVVGVDLDEDMIAEAQQAAGEAGVAGWVTHRQGDIQALPFDDASFDACRAERLFQVLPQGIEPQRVCAEIVRVLKPGGWFVVVDADWGTWSMDSSEVELERRLARFFADRLRPNGYAGRQFRRMFQRQGLVDLAVELFPTAFTDRTCSPFGGEWIDREAVAASIISQAEQERWRASLEQDDARQEFFATATMVMVAGRKP